MKFHQTVQTPNGPGLVQGKLYQPGEPERIIISHTKAVAAAAGLIPDNNSGIWYLGYYPPEDLREA